MLKITRLEPGSNAEKIHRFFRYGFIVALLAMVAYMAMTYDYFHTVPSGHTAMPQFKPGQRVLIHKGVRDPSEMVRGSVVYLRFQDPATGQPTATISRVLGLPGEFISIENGIVKIDGQSIDDRWAHLDLQAGYQGSVPRTKIPEGFIYILNDVRSEFLSDSRRLGPIPGAAILGKVIF